MRESDSANVAAQDDNEVEAPLDMFVDGAPDVAIAGIDLMRTTIVATDEKDAKKSVVRWHISAIPTHDDESPLILLGDLSVIRKGWFVGSTVTMMVDFREGYPLPDMDDEDAVNQLGRTLGPWASNALYDVAALVARQLVATSANCDVEIPRTTPKAHIARLRKNNPVASREPEDGRPPT